MRHPIFLVSGHVRANYANLDELPINDLGYKSLGACVDINECDTTLQFLHFCGEDATCINTDGSYLCQCNTGFRSGLF